MRQLVDLFKLSSDIWIYCDCENSQVKFLKQAQNEGFIALNGQKPTDLFRHKLYGISDDMTMGYLASMIWSLTFRENDNHIRVDYRKYLSGEEAYFYEKQ